MGAELILLFPIKSASTGPMGPAETAGAKDTAGPAGPAAATVSMNAQNTAASPLAIIIGKIAIPLPNDQFLNCFTINAANTIFTFPVTGTYFITYHIKATDALLMFWHIL